MLNGGGFRSYSWGTRMKTNYNAPNGFGLNQRIQNLVENLSEEKKELLLDLLVEWQQNEQRGDPRIPCLIAVDYSTPKRAYRDFIHDLSKSGLFIETREPLKVGESISLTFTMPGSTNHFKISGEIVRADRNGIGIRFNTKLSRYQEEIIRTHLNNKK
jgi:uncharacterized protein (TIGR02266 family)